MKKNTLLLSILIILLGLSSFSACDETEEQGTGSVTFGANYNVINCLTNVTVYVDNENIGTLSNSVDTITECGVQSNVTKELPVGDYSYKVEIRPEAGTGCTKDVNGMVTISENECEKIFIDFHDVFDSQADCDQDVVISPGEYQDAPNDTFSIKEMTITGDCLHITFAASGCDGNNWIVKLIDAGSVAESNPCQRTLRLSLDNNEACTAVPEKEISFNIKDLQIVGDDKVLLNVSGEQILYEY